MISQTQRKEHLNIEWETLLNATKPYFIKIKYFSISDRMLHISGITLGGLWGLGVS